MPTSTPSRASALLLAALLCGPACDSDPIAPPASWTVVAEDLDSALFSVAGVAADDVWVVGTDRGAGAGPDVLHWDGAAWSAPDTGLADGDLYWVHVGSDGVAYFAGSGGQIARRTAGGTFEIMPTPGARTVWGLWGAGGDDLWAVGGEAAGGTGFIWRHQAGTWTEVTLGAGLPSPAAWFKVWGAAADDVWFCGIGGALMHWNGADFSAVDAGTTRNLLTVHGRADGSVVTAVGGAFSATVVESAGGGPWQDVTPPSDAPPLQTFGVHHRNGDAWAVGIQAAMLRRSDAGWAVVEHGLSVFDDLHGVWIDPTGDVWAVGGKVVAPPFRAGLLLHHGTTHPAGAVPL